jgi:hypothetical protein
MEDEQCSKIQKQNVGNAWEYYIAARLSALDFVTTITLGRAEKYDMLALSPKGKLIKLSVKARQKENANSFPLSCNDERGAAADFYYAFVKLNRFESEPDFWIIPSERVCPVVKESHRRWLELRGKNNKEHKDSTVRLLPIKVTTSQRPLYPEDWEDEVKDYYKNLRQLR